MPSSRSRAPTTSFNAFFTRALRPGARPADADPAALVSPVDGTVSQIGRLDGSWLLQAKGHAYTLESLLAGEESWAARFRGGAFATLYLAPFNYHRVHMPLAGTLRAAWYVPGQLFSVNAVTAASVPGLFARNERIVCVFEDGALSFALVLVGALFVGSMSTVWHGEVTPRSPRQRSELPLDGGQRTAAAVQGRGDGTLQHGLDRHPAAAARAQRMGRRPRARERRAGRADAGPPGVSGPVDDWRPSAARARLEARARAAGAARASSSPRAACWRSTRRWW